MRLAGTKLAANHQYRGFGDQLYDLSGQRPSLDLNFANTKSLVDSITGQNLVTFTRASSGTYVDSQGVIRTATTNLLLRSEDLLTTWAKDAGVTITADLSQGQPFAGTQVFRVDYTGANQTGPSQAITYAAVPYAASVWVKGTAGETIRFTGQSGTAASNFTLTGQWQRLTLTWSGVVSPQAFTLNTFSSATARTIYVAAPQLEQSSTVGEYIPTTSTINSAPRFDHAITSSVTNVIWPSEDFTTTWGVASATRFADAGIAPNGTLTADRIESTGGGVFRSGVSVLSGVSYTYSVYVKHVSGTGVINTIGFERFGAVPLAGQTSFNVLTGTVVSNGAAVTASSITPVGDGWYRVSVRATSTDITTTIVNYTSVSGNQFLLWGAQLEQSSTAGEYVQTTSAPATASKTESLGLLVEEQRTNLSLQSDSLSDAYWAKVDCTITANQFTAPDGTLTADLWTNIPTAGGAVNNSMAKDANIRTYTASMWVNGTTSLFAMTLDFGGTVNRGRVSYNLATNTIVNTTNTGNFTNTSGTITPYANGWARLTLTTTTSTGTTIRFRSFFGTGGESVYVWGAQVEEGAFATSYIPTTTATVTRSADVASITGSNFSSWYRQDEGTVFAEGAVPVGVSGARVIASIDDGTTAERIQIGHNGTTAIQNLVVDGSSVQFSPTVVGASFPPGEYRKLAMAIKAADFAAITAPGTLATGGTGTMPTPTQLQIGFGPSRTQPNLPIKRLTYFPIRLANEVLQRITQ